MHIKKNMSRDIEIFKQRMAGGTLRAIGAHHAIGHERVRQIVNTIGRYCRAYVVRNQLPKPTYWDDDEYQNNKEYWLEILCQCEGALKLSGSGTLDTPLRLTAMNRNVVEGMGKIGVITVGDLQQRIKTKPADITRVYRGDVRMNEKLAKWIEEYTAV